MAGPLTPEEFGRLPTRAMFALAVRSAARERHLFDPPGDDPARNQDHAAVTRAVRIARDFAAGGPVPDDAYAAARLASDATDGCVPNEPATVPQNAFAVAFALGRMAEGRVFEVPWSLYPALRQFTPEFAAALRADYERLVSLGLGEFPKLGPAVDPSEAGPLGPLWPDGVAPA